MISTVIRSSSKSSRWRACRGGFAGLDLAAGKLPEPSERTALRAAGYEEEAVALDEGADDLADVLQGRRHFSCMRRSGLMETSMPCMMLSKKTTRRSSRPALTTTPSMSLKGPASTRTFLP